MKHVYKIYTNPNLNPVVTFSPEIALDVQRDAMNAGKRVLLTRMTIDNYRKELSSCTTIM